MTTLTRLTALLENRLREFCEALGDQDAESILERLTDLELFGTDMKTLSANSRESVMPQDRKIISAELASLRCMRTLKELAIMEAALGVMGEGCSLGTEWLHGLEAMPEKVVREIIEGMARWVSKGEETEVNGIGAPFRVREEVLKRRNSEIMKDWVD